MTGPQHQRTVVVGVDGSESAQEAAATAVEEAARRGAALLLVHALSWPAAATSSHGTGASALPELGGLLHAAAETVLRTASGDAADVLGPDRVSWSVVPGDPADALADAARGADLLVLGSRGVGGVVGLVIGSTVTAVLTAPPCPVLVLPDPTTAVVRPRATVVAAVEGRPGDDAVLAVAFTEAAMRGTDLLAVHAWQDVALETALLSAGPLVDWAGVLADEQRVLAEALAGWREKEPDVTVREAVVRERPARALLAAGLTAELLVVGGRRHRGLGRLGSTTHAVAHRAPCPIVVVPVDDSRGGHR
ncbi:universal stress protein [Geodermatophilus aquaeductus]|uniref:Nucleotide-binding universal stress protein, UspA family n=1 Tax=Geodermatophilus aquaeductus TaxID=1564161 RepID=A0A521EBC8_9ACTN|nr:universal stress protein [Geodermatophilus aquaeductus]SMO81235.1 Nucleotide-binding universal stress protein, UspA family [Geodermatophilus aquaeductus]